MKTFIILILLTCTVFATNIEKNYDKLNLSLDNIAKILTPQEKVKLYSLSLITYTRILSHKPLEQIENEMLRTLSLLHEENQNVSTQELEDIHYLYTQLKETEYKQGTVEGTSLLAITLSLVAALILGFILGLLLFYKKSSKYSDTATLLSEVQSQNMSLHKELKNSISKISLVEQDNQELNEKLKE